MCSFSVIIPAHNAEVTIGKCVDSVLEASNGFKVEIIIINDGSRDATGNICRNFAEDNPHIQVISQNNKGVSTSRNIGIHLAHGEYIVFVDADDEVFPNMFTVLSSIIGKGQPEIISFDFMPFDKAKAQIRPREAVVPHPYPKISRSDANECMYYFYERKLGTFSWSFCYRRSFLLEKEVSFPEDVSILEDAIFLRSILSNKIHVAYCPIPLYRYSINSNSSLTNKKSNRLAKQVICYIEQSKKTTRYEYPEYYVNLLLFSYSLIDFTKKGEASSLSNTVKRMLKEYPRNELPVSFRLKILLINVKLYRYIAMLWGTNE